MPLAPVDNHGTALFYEDSGIPNAKLNYTTLVLIHGIAFTSGMSCSYHSPQNGGVTLYYY